jgi:C4-dicarboxylate-specific signal transduction histidine kinase
VVAERRDYDGEFRVIRPGGEIRFVHCLAHPVLDASGSLSEYVGTVVDITEGLMAEEALSKVQAELTHVSRVMTLGQLTASIAHEVNQPLGAIVTNGQASLRLLSRKKPDIHGAREAVEAMISDGLRAAEVIKRIRSLLKKGVDENTELSLNDAIREVAALMSNDLNRANIHLQTNMAQNLPPVRGDRVQLQQVVLNLILNSKEAMSRPGLERRDLLITSAKKGTAELLVSFRDTGPGLDSFQSELVFDPFFSTKEGGLGLGLSISRTIIEVHGGRLWTTPNVNGPGATFHFTLPVAV